MFLGLFVLCISYAVGGAWVFMMLEKPYEEEQHQLKIVSTQKKFYHNIIYLFERLHTAYHYVFETNFYFRRRIKT